MICNKCGNECPEGSLFCTGCGARFEEEAPIVFENEPAEPTFEQPEPTNYYDPNAYIPMEEYAAPAPAKKSKLPLILAAVAAVVVVALAALFFLGGSKAESIAVEYVTAMFMDDPDTIEEYSFKKWKVDGDDKVLEDIDDVEIDVIASIEYPNEGILEDEFDDLSKNRFNKKDVEEYHVVFMLLTVSYDGDEYDGSASVEVFKVEGEWYARLIDTDMEDDFYDDYDVD